MQAQDLVQRVAAYDKGLADDLQKFLGSRKLGLVYEESKPEYVRLTNKPVVTGDLVNVLPPRGTMEDLTNDDDEHDVIWRVVGQHDKTADLRNMSTGEEAEASSDDLVAVARFDQPIYCGLTETGHVERGGKDDPYQVVINGENFHALESLLYCYEKKVDCIYIDPPYNTGAKDWKYNNNYVSGDDAYRHSKWLTFMEDRLKLAKKLLNPKSSVLICTIDEKEYLRLGLLLEQLFHDADIQMISSVIMPSGSSRAGRFGRADEYIFYCFVGDSEVRPWITDMLRPNDSSKRHAVRWNGLIRNGEGSRRSRIPSLFYPILLDEQTGSLVSVGDPIPADMDVADYVVPKGLVAMWPIDKSGNELMWRLYPPTLRDYFKKGYAKLGKRDPETGCCPVSYLQSGMISKYESGEIVCTGKTAEGTLILQYSDSGKTFAPLTVWNQVSHSAAEHGSGMLKRLIPGRHFTFPKSLYAVEDTLRFVVGNKPDALIVDFFSGSGTTVHAVMRLNHQDGGYRRCICVTNNEVSADEAKAMTKRGLRAGDEEWEERGIARYVTVPRVTAAITGKTPEGEPIKGDYKFTDEFPMADGFEENAVFYDLTHLEPSVVSADLAFDEVAPLLWLRSGSRGPVIMHGDSYEVTDAYGVLFDYTHAAGFIEECHKRDVDHVFVVTDIDANYRRMCSEFRGRDVAQLYKSYLRSFEIGADR